MTSLAPNWDVPENVSPFVPLPLLKRCRRCTKPMYPIEAMAVVVAGRAVTPLCQRCANTVMATAGEHEHEWRTTPGTTGLKRALPFVACWCGETGYQAPATPDGDA